MKQRAVGRSVLITGASRGIGAETAVQLGAEGAAIAVNFREKKRRADAVVRTIEEAGGRALAVGADVTDPEAVDAMLNAVVAEFGAIDVLVLNASGGLELGADPGYAMSINRDAQVAMARAVADRMKPGSRIVFLTSHQAHFYGRKPVPVEYEPIAASKRAGEDALRDMILEMNSRGIELVVVSGDMIEGTIVVTLLERRNPDAVAARTAQGALPTVAEFAAAVVDAAVGPIEKSGRTVYVGGADYLDGFVSG
ncbi:SDR family oxidoreductase [Rhodococcus sp. ARC_M12]|uniref:SDR family oxidoreductase n=1 Tax=Rhodococcus sp. ARC_M12 TaxID=2928854 RepID=UPI001FB41714|nr:SDR family oxidoreductase [Rhodococcus sp. ARC_M12]MCJ0978030.1 SDR family oxidoreductase [Rhodococcus sp. ARC_M12]